VRERYDPKHMWWKVAIALVAEGPRHSAIYEIDGPHVLVSPEWAKAVEAGRWPGEVRPFTRNRRHALYKVR
jgi:hypothetical protein